MISVLEMYNKVKNEELISTLL